MRIVPVLSCLNCPYGIVKSNWEVPTPMEVFCLLQDMRPVARGFIITSLHEDCPLPDPELWIKTYKSYKDQDLAREFEEHVGRIRFSVAYYHSKGVSPKELKDALPRRKKP